jgi:hypothetical protein
MGLDGMPQGGALVRADAFRFKDARQHMFVCMAGSGAYRELLPSGLEWNDGVFPEGTLVVWVVRYGSFFSESDPDTSIGYDELVISLPCRHESSGPAFYIPFIYLNEFRPTAYGRELFGYPKKLAEISFVEAAGHTEVRVVSDLGYPLASVSWKEPVGATSSNEAPEPRQMVNWRRFPAAGSTPARPEWAVDELLGDRVCIDQIHSIVPLEVDEKSVKLFGGREDPLRLFGELRTIAATRVIVDWSIPALPTVLEDFVKR